MNEEQGTGKERTQQDELRIRLFGLNSLVEKVANDAENASPEAATALVEDHVAQHIKQEILDRRRNYLKHSRLQSPSKPSLSPTINSKSPVAEKRKRQVLRLGLLLLLVCGGSLFALREIQAARLQNRVNNHRFAENLLLTVTDLFCEDLLLLEQTAAEASIALPQEPSWPMDDKDWQYLLSSSNAIQGLAAARAGHSELTMRYLEAAQEALPVVSPNQPQVGLIHRIAQARSNFALIELFGNRGMLDQFDKKSFTEAAVQSSTACFEELSETQYGSEAHQQLLLAAAEIDLARIDLKTSYFRQHSDWDYRVTEAYLTAARVRLDSLEMHDAAWWTQHLRLEGNRILLSMRKARASTSVWQRRIMVDEIRSTNELLYSANEFLDTQNEKSRYRNSVYFELGVCLGNTADLLNELHEKLRFETRSIQKNLRKAAIENLKQVKLPSRSVRHLENLALNYGRLFFNSIEDAIITGTLVERPPEIQQHAIAFETVLGDRFDAQIGQVAPAWRAALAMIRQTKQPEEIKAFLQAKSAHFSDKDKAILNRLQTELSQQ